MELCGPHLLTSLFLLRSHSLYTSHSHGTCTWNAKRWWKLVLVYHSVKGEAHTCLELVVPVPWCKHRMSPEIRRCLVCILLHAHKLDCFEIKLPRYFCGALLQRFMMKNASKWFVLGITLHSISTSQLPISVYFMNRYHSRAHMRWSISGIC